jgi:hypothetical protein
MIDTVVLKERRKDNRQSGEDKQRWGDIQDRTNVTNREVAERD